MVKACGDQVQAALGLFVRHLGFMRLSRLWARSMQRKPIVAIIGTTGAGKSRLGVDIARACNGEVINADAMQVYRGLDVLTNKITLEEMKGVSHHLLGFKEPGDEYVVGHWIADAMAKVCA